VIPLGGASSWRHRAGGGAGRAALPKGRLTAVAIGFCCAFGLVAGRLVFLGAAAANAPVAAVAPSDAMAAARPDLIDRNGEVMATDIRSVSLFAEPRRIVDPDEATEKLASVLPDLDAERVRKSLATNAGFVWLKREITRAEQKAIHALGIPGVGFRWENKRFYPSGTTASHILGLVNIDNEGLAGAERFIDGLGLSALHETGLAVPHALEPFRFSIDMRVQHAVRDEVEKAVQRYRAIAGVGIVLDVRTGEVIAMSSLPDYDPNVPAQALDKDRMNRAMVGVFEMGSTFKMFTTAMALDSGLVGLADSFDARAALQVDGFRINDFHGKHRVLTVPEIFIYSSNIGTAKMALTVGIEQQKAFLARLGLLDALRTELPETATPTQPRKWSKLSSITISFGHGVSVTPMQTAVAAAALINGGYYIPPTFLPRTETEAATVARRVVSEETSAAIRDLMRLNVVKGSGRRAGVAGYRVGGKTGTAEKVVNGRYASDKRRNAFIAGFPMDDPRYLVLVVLDEPKPEKPGAGATAGSNAAPTVGEIIRRAAPMLGVMPKLEPDTETLPALAAAR